MGGKEDETTGCSLDQFRGAEVLKNLPGPALREEKAISVTREDEEKTITKEMRLRRRGERERAEENRR